MITRTAYITIVVPVLVAVLVIGAIAYASWSAYRFDRIYGPSREVEPAVRRMFPRLSGSMARWMGDLEQAGGVFARAACVIGPMVAAAALTAFTVSHYFKD